MTLQIGEMKPDEQKKLKQKKHRTEEGEEEGNKTHKYQTKTKHFLFVCSCGCIQIVICTHELQCWLGYPPLNGIDCVCVWCERCKENKEPNKNEMNLIKKKSAHNDELITIHNTLQQIWGTAGAICVLAKYFDGVFSPL